jgi:hypothetical protein
MASSRACGIFPHTLPSLPSHEPPGAHSSTNWPSVSQSGEKFGRCRRYSCAQFGNRNAALTLFRSAPSSGPGGRNGRVSTAGLEGLVRRNQPFRPLLSSLPATTISRAQCARGFLGFEPGPHPKTGVHPLGSSPAMTISKLEYFARNPVP